MQTLSRLRVENFLSLREIDLDLQGLNVLVGPNGTGKSNILHVFEFLGEVARLDLVPAIEAVGGFEQLRFRGERTTGGRVKIELEGNVTTHASAKAPDRYMLSFSGRKVRRREGVAPAYIIDRTEEIALKRTKGRGRRITLRGSDVDFSWEGKAPKSSSTETLSLKQGSTGLATIRRLGSEYDADQVEALAQVFESLRLFEVDVPKARRPSAAEQSPRLSADASNLAAFLLWLHQAEPGRFELLLDDIKYILPSFQAFRFESIGGSDSAIRLSVVEDHLSDATPLARVSFGTMRAIALFAMLHDPNPPKLTCLEEIDHGLHPHALDRIVERLRDASERTQIIVATHSPALVNRLAAEELVIVERDEDTGGTRTFRPSASLVSRLSQDNGYELGELWFSGALGGGL